MREAKQAYWPYFNVDLNCGGIAAYGSLGVLMTRKVLDLLSEVSRDSNQANQNDHTAGK